VQRHQLPALLAKLPSCTVAMPSSAHRREGAGGAYLPHRINALGQEQSPAFPACPARVRGIYNIQGQDGVAECALTEPKSTLSDTQGWRGSRSRKRRQSTSLARLT